MFIATRTRIDALARQSFARFLGAGAVGAIVNLSVYATCLAGRLPVALAVVIAFTVAATSNYYCYQRHVFTGAGSLHRSLLVAVVACLANTAIVVGLVGVAGAPAFAAWALGIAFVAPGNFQVHRRWVFA